uniref:Uncharacterized protein n=1 Tax=Haematobia irritans TaxID=7368 RepID=A0A1L8E6P6_HAEIR
MFEPRVSYYSSFIIFLYISLLYPACLSFSVLFLLDSISLFYLKLISSVSAHITRSTSAIVVITEVATRCSAASSLISALIEAIRCRSVIATKVITPLWTTAVALLVIVAKVTTTTISTPSIVATTICLWSTAETTTIIPIITLVIPWCWLVIPASRALIATKVTVVTETIVATPVSTILTITTPTTALISTIVTTATAWTSWITTATLISTTTTTSSLTVHILFGNSFLNIQGFVFNGMGFL